MSVSLSRKISLLGDFAVGKTSTVARSVRNTFSEVYLTTVGVKVDTKVLADVDGHSLRLVLWDIAGAFTMMGCAAAIFAEPDQVALLLEPSIEPHPDAPP